jgi:ABC-type nitrate/sulfonate/bicarbonate transport system permease component
VDWLPFGDDRSTTSTETRNRPTAGAAAQRRAKPTVIQRPASLSANRVLVGQLAIIIVVFGLMEVVVGTGLVSPLFLAAPSVMLPLFLGMLPSELLGLAVQTLVEAAAALLLAGSCGVLAGYALWRFPTTGMALEGLLSAVFATPLILLYPVALVLLGRTNGAVVAVAALTSIIPITLTTRGAFVQVNPVLLQLGRSLGMSARGMFWEILLPAAAPGIFTGLRLGLGYIFKATLLMEFIVNIGGLGRRAAIAYDLLDIPRLYASIFAVMLLSVVFVAGLNRAERTLRRG